MKRVLLLIVIASLGFAVSGCSSVGGKVVEHKVKKAVPGAQTKGEKATKKAKKSVKKTESKINHR